MQPVLLVIIVVVSYALLAGGPQWTLVPLLMLCMLGVLVNPARTLRLAPHTRALDLALIAIIAGIGLQMLPLPSRVTAMISPHAASVAAELRLTFAAGGVPSFVPLSLDLKRSAAALGIMAMGIMSFWIARSTFAEHGQSRRFCRLLTVLAGGAATLAMVQKAIAPRLLMGVVDPGEPNANPMGPFMNRNHFGAWVLMAACLSTGYLMAHLQIHPAYRDRLRTAIWQFLKSGAMLFAASVVTMVGSLLTTLSRSAAVGLAVAVVSGSWYGRERLKRSRHSRRWTIGLAIAAVAAVAAFVDPSGWLTRLQHSLGTPQPDSFDRMTIWRESAPIVRDFFAAGTGAGTYGLAMIEYQQTRFWVGAMRGWTYFNNAHSHYIQLAAEGGLLLGIPVLIAIYQTVRQGIVALRSDKGEVFWIRVGAAAGLTGVAVQSVWEVPLTMPANAILCGTLAGALLYRRTPSSRPTQPL